MGVDYCSPEPDGHTYDGWHITSLKRYETREAAERVAERYGNKVFYCEYGGCWHLSSPPRTQLYGTCPCAPLFGRFDED